jgi:hypothetical protein
MKKLLGVFLFVAFALFSCKSGDIVSAVKKGHFNAAPNITLEELVGRYQFVDAASINWTSITDANKNDFAEVSAKFDDNLGIIFNGIQGMISSGMMDVTVLMGMRHNFFDALLNEEGFKVDDGSSSYMSLRFNMFEPGYGDPNAPYFFNCNGGTLTVDFTVDKSGLVKIAKATLIFDMQSPMENGDIKEYQLIYPIQVEAAENMLVNNTEVGTE